MNDNKQPMYFQHTSGTKKEDVRAKLQAEIDAAGDSDDNNNDNKQPPVRNFWYAEDRKKEDDMVETAATDAVGDNNPSQDPIIGRVDTVKMKRCHRRRCSCNMQTSQNM